MAAVWHGLTPKVLARFLTLGLPGGIMMGVDAASFDVTTVMASVLGKQIISHLFFNCKVHGRGCCSDMHVRHTSDKSSWPQLWSQSAIDKHA